MAVKIGSARIDENGKARGGKAGDQKGGKEVSIQDWYAHSPSWNVVIRAKNKANRKKIANAMKKACANNNIGYDQNERLTLYKYAKEVNYDISKVKKACECDCSSLVSLCLIASGYTKISPSCTTSSIEKDIKNKYAKNFELFTSREYTQSSAKLLEGDIVNCAGHHVVIVTESTNKEETKSTVSTKPKATTTTKKVVGNEKVKELQKALNNDLKLKLDVNGIIGSNTTNAMKKVIIKKPLIGNNNKYPNVTKFVQKQVGLTGKSIDGIYGSKTKSKVLDFQKKHKLSKDGIVGYNTLLKLIQ